jgi:photosystem II stability/assembly factor-like uncharacterized protein
LNRLNTWCFRTSPLLLLLWAALAIPARALDWFPLGPYGGDARSFAADPHDSKHLYLGTANGWIYESHDGGDNWVRLSQIAKRNDLILDHILADAKNPRRLIVGAYYVDRPDGGLYLSEDGGRTWSDIADMRGQSVRSLVRAPSNPDMLVAGTLQGVFRSMDDGKSWQLISPAGSLEIHEIESLAVDPANPEVIYAGTWHLPWKTVDGGAHWENIKKGIIEDSDVFSIIIDPEHTNIVYASACSGIYKSLNAGLDFKGGVSLNKLQGIPSSARRTRKLMQDPQHLETVYAGTTEGLYRTLDGGQTWDRMTSSEVIINDVYVDPNNANHVLLATDRGGVLRSEDAATTFLASNTGFSARQVAAYAADPRHPSIVYAGVVNDKETGGVFQSRDGGINWHQQSVGLGGRDVFSLATTPSGIVLAGTAHGIFRLGDGLWTDSGTLLTPSPPKSIHTSAAGRKAVRPKTAVMDSAAQPARVDAAVYALVSDTFGMYAGTSQGLLRADAEGMAWTPVTSLPMTDTRFVAMDKGVLMVAGLRRIALSTDDGYKWTSVALPASLTQISSIAVDSQKNLWAGGLEGVWYSPDNGATWHQIHDLEIHQVGGIYFDAPGNRVLLTTSESTVIFAVSLPSLKVTYWDTGWKLRFARPVGDHLVGVTLYDGIVVQPKMVDSSVSQAQVALHK